MSEEVISKSKQKREQRKAEAAAMKKKKNLDSIIGWIVGIVIGVVVIGSVVWGIISSIGVKAVEPSNNFGAGLTEEGFIEGAKLDKVKDLDLESLEIPLSEVEFTDEDVENAITSLCSENSYYSEDKTLRVKDGDTINLDYVGYVNDVPFAGGDTQGNGAVLTIGSGKYIDTFEQQLIDARPGDKVTVNVTFPDPYESNPDLAGKPARFDCVVNSIQITPEFTDEFVAEKFSDIATTAADYRTYLKNDGYRTNVQNYISTYIMNNAKASSMPKEYVNSLRSLIYYYDTQNYEYYNSYYSYAYGVQMYNSFSDYTQMTDDEYQKQLVTDAKQQAAYGLTFEKYFRDHNLTITDEAYANVLESYGGEMAESIYSVPYLKQVAIRYAVVDYLADKVTVK